MMDHLGMRVGLEGGGKEERTGIETEECQGKHGSPKLTLSPTASHAFQLPLFQIALCKINLIINLNNTTPVQCEIMCNLF